MNEEELEQELETLEEKVAEFGEKTNLCVEGIFLDYEYMEDAKTGVVLSITPIATVVLAAEDEEQYEGLDLSPYGVGGIH